jgi:hypothetical protein
MSTNGNGAGGEPGGATVPGRSGDVDVSPTTGVSAGGPPAEASLETARVFIDAVVWGDHAKVWQMLGAEGRTEVLDVATKRGMDEGLAARLGSGTASPAEMNEFLVDLVNGLRAELAGNDLDHLTYTLDEAESNGNRVAVIMHVPLHPLLGGTLPVGTLYLAVESGDWKVERLIPLTSK